MALQREQTYMVLNYSGSPVCINTKTGSYCFQGGTKDEPYGLPLTIDEIVTANMNGSAFKTGLLFFEDEFEEDIYRECRINNWKSILKDWEIEDILINPTKEGYEKIINIDNNTYFARVLGIMFGLQSIFIDVPNKSKLIVEARRDELANGKRKSTIKISECSKADNPKYVSELEQQNQLLQEQLKTLMEQVSNLAEKSSNNDEPQTKTQSTRGRPKKSLNNE